MNIFKKIFKRSKTVDDIFDKDNGHLTKMGKWIDNWSHTSQEKAALDKELIEGVQKHAVETMSENTERSKARRELAVLTIKFYFLIVFLCGMTFPFHREWSAMWFKLATLPWLGSMVIGVCGFFWGVHVLRQHQNKKGK